MKEYFVKEVDQSILEAELNAFASQGWSIFKIHPTEVPRSTYWTIICEREKPLSQEPSLSKSNICYCAVSVTRPQCPVHEKEPSLLDYRHPKYQEVLKLVNKHGFDIRSNDTAHQITKDFLKWHEAQRGGREGE